MARPRRSQATRERLIEEGVSSFVSRGYHGTGLQEILDRVRVPKGSFYNYFKSKEDFGAETIRHYSDCLGRKMVAALAGAADPLAGLKRFFRGLMAEFEDSEFVGGCLVANLGGELEGSDICRGALAVAFRQWRDAVRDALRKAQDRGLVRRDIDATELADMLVEGWEGAVIRMKIERSLVPLRRCLRRFLDGHFRP